MVSLSLMQNEGETDNKAVIMISFNDFSAPSKGRTFIFKFFYQFTYTTQHSCCTNTSNYELI